MSKMELISLDEMFHGKAVLLKVIRRFVVINPEFLPRFRSSCELNGYFSELKLFLVVEITPMFCSVECVVQLAFETSFHLVE